jgi:pilus assembly protein TadC
MNLYCEATIMMYDEMNKRINNVDDLSVRSALKDIMGSCRKQGMTADETYEYIMNVLKGMK